MRRAHRSVLGLEPPRPLPGQARNADEIGGLLSSLASNPGEAGLEHHSAVDVNPEIAFVYDRLQGAEIIPENTTRGVLRPTSVLTCYFRRRRIGPYLDGALPEREARMMAVHLGACGRCRSEAGDLGRVRGMVRSAVVLAEPDWTGFWPGIIRGVEAGATVPVRSGRLALSRRVTMAGAVAAALLAITLWQAGDSPTVAVANTEYPDGSVMVYSTPGDDMTVIWVFGPDKNAGSGSI
ncbi:MAG: hypothetical protein DMD82_15890 [Candidatus Rokuibacteriota bacterium]|nr:MAG: hypothetical protein DMD82_15890 [Candidatus Rokubacteria bacterium]